VLIFNEMLDSIQSSAEAQKRFTSDVSHEIRSPLTSLRGSIEVTLRRKRTPEEYEEMLRSNLADTIRLSKIADNLLFLAKADNNILEFRKQWVDVRKLIENIVEGHKGRISQRGVSIDMDCRENLMLSGDIDLLEQAFLNILDNAVKYTSPGGKVTINAMEDISSISVTVSDKGPALPENEITHIFERFYRGSKAGGTKPGGTAWALR